MPGMSKNIRQRGYTVRTETAEGEIRSTSYREFPAGEEWAEMRIEACLTLCRNALVAYRRRTSPPEWLPAGIQLVPEKGVDYPGLQAVPFRPNNGSEAASKFQSSNSVLNPTRANNNRFQRHKVDLPVLTRPFPQGGLLPRASRKSEIVLKTETLLHRSKGKSHSFQGPDLLQSSLNSEYD